MQSHHNGLVNLRPAIFQRGSAPTRFPLMQSRPAVSYRELPPLRLHEPGEEDEVDYCLGCGWRLPEGTFGLALCPLCEREHGMGL